MKRPALLVILLVTVSATAETRFILHPEQGLGPPIVGFGAQFSPYILAPQLGQEVQNLDDLERKLRDLGPQHVRIFVLTQWITPGHERELESLVRTVKLAQDSGATVNLTLWYGWLKDPKESSQRMVQILDDLIRKRGLSAVQYVTLQNEVNTTKITMQQYDEFYRLFDADLRQAKLRERIKIVGGDLLGKEQSAWLTNLATELRDVCDGYSAHTYWEYTNPGHITQRLGNLHRILTTLPTTRPLYLTEFGVRGRGWEKNDPGVHEDGTPIAQTAVHAEQCASFMIEAIRQGAVATVQWEAYDVFYDKPMHCGMIGES